MRPATLAGSGPDHAGNAALSSNDIAQTLLRLDWRSDEYREAPLSCLKKLAESGPVALTDIGYAILSRDDARPVLRADLPISLYHIPEAASPYLAERTKHPLLVRHELCRKIGDEVNQAADLISATASIPSLNFIPLTTFGNWF